MTCTTDSCAVYSIAEMIRMSNRSVPLTRKQRYLIRPGWAQLAGTSPCECNSQNLAVGHVRFPDDRLALK